MAKLTVVFGVLLLILGGVAFFVLGHHPHTLIPAVFGLLLAALGSLAETPDTKKRALFMHIAVTIGLLGFLGTVPGLIAVIRRAAGQVVASPAVDAARVQAIMGTLCLVFVVLCVRSFIAARKARLA
jgi:hypothetical protein